MTPLFSQKINVQGPTCAPPVALWSVVRLFEARFRAARAASIALLSSPRKATSANPTRPTTRTSHMTTQRHRQRPSPTSDARLTAAKCPRRGVSAGRPGRTTTWSPFAPRPVIATLVRTEHPVHPRPPPVAAQVRETTRRRSCRTALHKARPPSCTRASRRDAAPPQPLRRSSIRPVSPSAASRVNCTTTGDVSIRRLRMSADAGYRRRRPCRSREGTNLHSEARRHPRAVLLAARRGLIARQAPAVAPGASAPFSSPAVSRAERQLSAAVSGALVNSIARRAACACT